MTTHDDSTCPTCAEWRAFRDRYRDPRHPDSILLPPLSDMPESARRAWDHWREHHPLR